MKLSAAGLQCAKIVYVCSVGHMHSWAWPGDIEREMGGIELETVVLIAFMHSMSDLTDPTLPR